MGLAATPVDAELASAGRASGLIRSIGTVVEGSDYETPNVLGYLEGAADQAEDYNPGRNADPNVPNGPGENDYETPNPQRDSRVRWIDGYSIYPDDCDGGHIVDPCQLGSNADVADTGQASIIGPIQPFVIEASDKCSTFGAPHDFRLARAQRKLLAVQSKVLEAEFWNGTKAQSQTWANNQYLRKAGVTVLGTAPVGGPFGIVDGLAALEQAISDGSAWERGVIHASPQLVTHWAWQGLVKARPSPPGTLMTELGTIVVAGGGYDGSGPQNQINPNHYEWAYATPVPQIRLGQITYNETDTDTVAVDRLANDRIIRASRFASIVMSGCFRAAALIDMTVSLKVPGS